MTHPTDKVVPLLDGVKKTGATEWVAKCPAHDDKSPSLAIREADDGRLLMHCFAGCTIESILHALDLDMGDLFAEPLAHRHGPIRHPFSPAAVLKAIAGESAIVAVAGADAVRGVLSEADRARMLKAIGRINEAVRYA